MTSINLKFISYEDWMETYEKNIRPLPRWWKDAEQRMRNYKDFARFINDPAAFKFDEQ